MGEHWKEILDISIHKHDKTDKQIKLINIIGICNSVNSVFPIPYGVYIVYMHPLLCFFNLLYIYNIKFKIIFLVRLQTLMKLVGQAKYPSVWL